MVSLGSLWLPIILSSVLVFITSSIVHMVLRYHHKDYTKLPNEDAVRAAIRGANPPPAQYIIPYCPSPKEMQSAEMKQKWQEGPVVVMNVIRPGVPAMGKNLVQWFVFSLVVSLLIAYAAAHTIPPGVRYMDVFRPVAVVGFLAYAMGQLPAAIWMGKPWKIAWKEVFDGLLYGLVTGGTFGWLWPR
jgi:hypothetical protein